ncbi:MAG: PAS domain-containing protein [Ruminiclostridium sp.]|nr:PAS domain-containing protein [Ruminiclostridium sp.]
MTGKIFRGCFVIGLVAIFLSSTLFLMIMTDRNEKDVYRDMKELTAYAAHGVETWGMDYLENLDSSHRLTWVTADGMVLYDSVADQTQMENHLDREEIIEALETGEGYSEHESRTLLEKNLYYALLLEDGTVLRVACTQTTLGAMFLEVAQPILWMIALSLVLSAVLASSLARQITRPINSLDLERPDLDKPYEELAPLVGRIREQNRTISRQMEELRQRQREFSALAANMSEGLLILNNKYTILSANQSALGLLGETSQPESLRQDRCPREVWQAAAEALAGRHGEAFLRTEDQIFEILASPVTSSGHVTGAMVLMVDVTEREERENLRREFSANVSHELKTPLTAISGFAELMKEGLVAPDMMKEFAGDIYRECSQLIALVDDILKLSRLDEGSGEIQEEVVDLYAMSADVLERLRPNAAKRAVSLYLEGDHQQITGVWRILDEMIYNLCENAIKYNKEGGRVNVRVTGDSRSAVVSVEDTGIGIPKAQQDRVFERFYRVDKSHSRAIGGTGLGLSIVKHGAQVHNAQVTLESEPDVGTTVTITFRKER